MQVLVAVGLFAGQRVNLQEKYDDPAFGKLYELQALRRFVSQRPKFIGLLPEERPGSFELVLVGNHRHPVRRQVLAQIEALADQRDVRMRPVPDVSAAAAHVVRAERK